MSQKAIIIGAGPAGLTAAYELLKRTDIIPIVLEKSGDIGGISKTINYKGNRMDMGPHRFFSKSDRVMNWWLNIIPLEADTSEETTISYQNKKRKVGVVGQKDATTGDGGSQGDRASAAAELDSEARQPGSASQKDSALRMLVIRRLTRIYFLRKFFAYPIQLSYDTLRTLGLVRTVRIMLSYLKARLFPRRPVNSLEDFIINQFGRELYLLFFKDYTEKVWGVPCEQISAEWGAQRIKGVSLSKAIGQAIKNLRRKKGGADIGQKDTETSLIEQFLYPKRGPGSLWEEVARQVEEMGGQVYLNQDVRMVKKEGDVITSVHTVNSSTGQAGVWEGEYFFSTMPVQELICNMEGRVPASVKEIAAGLQYRDFINVGILLRQLSARGKDGGAERLDLKDNWIYIQERDVKVGRLMIYNNWGDGMIKDPDTVWIGMEYFCNKTDAFWGASDEDIRQTAIEELVKMDLARAEDVLDSNVVRMEKTYPAYFGTYDRFGEVRDYLERFSNLFLVGRNGMHKYNNADHSMLTAMVAVDNILAGVTSKANLWSINTEQEYHEEKAAPETVAPEAGTAGEDGPLKEDGSLVKRPTTAKGQPEPIFADYIWRKRSNRAYLLFALAAFLVEFILFKFRYPYANYMPDSYSYLQAAASNADVNMWPVAYSKFLRLVSVFTHSDKIVVGLQYFFLQISSYLFLFTLLYFLKPGRKIKNVLYAFLIANPIPLYVSNYISADALFISLSLLWLTTLLWVIYRPRRWQIGVQAFLLLACFTVRYNAIYYPVIAALAFLLSREGWKFKTIGIALGVLLVGTSVAYTSNKMQLDTGRRQFSAFGGWQLANNALYMYQNIPAAQRSPVPARFAKLEQMVREHIDTIQRVKLTRDDTVNSYFYLWSGRGPLIQYMNREWGKDSTTPYFKKWASEGPLYSAYGMYLIRKYPVQFVESFMLPNAIKYAVPPDEFLGTYNMGQDSVGRIAKDWFNYKSVRVREHNKKGESITVMSWYPVFWALVNVLLVISLVGLLVFRGFKNNPLTGVLVLVISLWLVNMGFSVFASPIVLRYQVFPVLIIFFIAVIAFQVVVDLAKQEEIKNSLS